MGSIYFNKAVPTLMACSHLTDGYIDLFSYVPLKGEFMICAPVTFLLFISTSIHFISQKETSPLKSDLKGVYYREVSL